MSYLVDYHLHTEFSIDAEGSPLDFVRAGVDAGLSEICFTDHMDFLTYDESHGFFRPHEYLRALQVARDEAGKKLQVKAGMELGIEPEIVGQAVTAAGQEYFRTLDFVIGSVHGVEGRLLGNGYFEGKSSREACRKYLADLNTGLGAVAAVHAIDVVGHLDLVKRYAPWQPDEKWFDESRDLFEAIIEMIVRQGVGLEVNTSGFRQRPLKQFPSVEILDIYRKRGGEILSIGSDSHSPAMLVRSAHFCRRAFDAITAAGFRYFTVFDSRKPRFIPLE